MHVEARAKRLQFGAPRSCACGGARCRVELHFSIRAAVVEKPDRHLVGRIGHRLRGGERGGQQVGILVVGRDEDVDGRQVLVVDLAATCATAAGSTTTKRLRNSMMTLYISAR